MAEHADLRPSSRLRGLFLCSLALSGLLGGTARGQNAEGTAFQPIRLKAYGMYSYTRPDYFGDTRGSGATIGVDIDAFHLLPRTEAGLDIRYGFSDATNENQSYFGGGPRVSLNLGPLKPYGDFLVGRGKGVFNFPSNPTYTQDTTSAFAYGGGLDLRVTRSWSVRADVQRQRWRFSTHTPYFYPVAIGVGLSYQLRFHSRTGPNL